MKTRRIPNTACMVFLLAATLTGTLAADPPVNEKASLSLPAVFSDHMVLQQGKPVAVWGTAPAESAVTVEFGGQSQTATAGPSGSWKLYLDAVPPSFEPQTLTVRSSGCGGVIQYADVLVGEVWLCGGQSNMAWGLQRTSHAAESAELFAGRDAVRFFNAPTPRTHLETNGWDSWRVADAQTARQVSAVGSLFGLHLHTALRTPVGIIICASGGTSTESWISKEALDAEPAAVNILRADRRLEEVYSGSELAAAEAEFLQYQKTRTGREPFGPWSQRRPGLMFANGLQPLVPYTVAGFVYYQGEAQSGRGAQMRHLLSRLIQDWRSHWNDPQLPFVIVQLPAYGVNGNPEGVSWAEVRESQRAAASETDRCALVVLIDSGEKDDVHPTYKKHVGERSALAALALAYGKPVRFSGPVFRRRVSNPDGSVTLEFDVGSARLTAQSGRLETGVTPSADGAVAGFTACGGEGVFVPAAATLAGANRVHVRHRDGRPVGHVRYAWKNWPEAGLANDAGLPASPFRTDTLPLESDANVQGVWPGYSRFLH